MAKLVLVLSITHAVLPFAIENVIFCNSRVGGRTERGFSVLIRTGARMAPCQDGAHSFTPPYLPLSIHREPMPSPLLNVASDDASSNNKFCTGRRALFLLALPPLWLQKKEKEENPHPQASKKGQQLHPTTCTNRTRLLERNGPAIPIRFRCCCSPQMFQFSLVSSYSSSFFIIQVGCCCCPASSLALVFDQLVAVGELC